MLQLLGIPEPVATTRGQLQVKANDLLRQRIDAFFPNDPWGMTRFLYWYAEREIEPAPPVDDPMADLAERLLVDRAFLDDIVALLADKGQVILYGPPGTGKTYLARKLAEALVPDPTRRMLVQFHPSTSYEDFFEGYRPETGVGGDMSYRLTPGPLALLAGRAADAPGKRHIMIIDEINRANLPKVLGELLFLFEYRDEQVRTLYRPDDAFQLPKDLWFIGTMNTADRSIALVDAALRRRFNFIPFFPDRGPMQGLLDRWLTANGQPAWVGELVAMVNDEISKALGGSHLLLGPSHFMKSGIDETLMRRIWEYNIEPFIEDQFFGDPSQIERFRFPAVKGRYLEWVGVTELDLLTGPADGEPSDAGAAAGLAVDGP
ncbi:MAG: AAA family ATPase [Ardenticatenia bacterium]|nr:AAA family ATPase [Ardenticatenia bacterium]